MIHAHIFEYMRDAHYYAYRFIDEHRHEIEKIKKPSIFIVILKNGDEHHSEVAELLEKMKGEAE